MTEHERQKLEAIFSVLDGFLGDTDPYFSEDITDTEIREEEPVFWAAKEIDLLLRMKQ